MVIHNLKEVKNENATLVKDNQALRRSHHEKDIIFTTRPSYLPPPQRSFIRAPLTYSRGVPLVKNYSHVHH